MPINILSDSELAALREEIVGLLPDTCRIERPTYVSVKGKVSETWGTAVASANCRVDPVHNSLTPIAASQEQGAARWQLTLEWDADILDGDRIVFNSKIYQVETLHEDHSLRAVRRAILVRRGENG